MVANFFGVFDKNVLIKISFNFYLALYVHQPVKFFNVVSV